MSTINILYSGDKGIERGLLMSALSIARCTGRRLHMYVLTMGYDAPEKRYDPVSEGCICRAEEILRSANPESRVACIDVSEQFLEELPEKNLNTRFTPGCTLRLYADLVGEIPEKVLYLDYDVLCRDGGGLEALYDTDVGTYEYAAVLDHYGSWFFREKFWRRDYVNSGVLLLNMARIRQTGLFRKCREACRTQKMFLPDQTALNRLAKSKKLLPGKYNDQRRLHADTVLQHFTTSFRFFPVFHYVTVKPWEQEKVHRVLKLTEYDDLFAEYDRWTADLNMEG